MARFASILEFDSLVSVAVVRQLLVESCVLVATNYKVLGRFERTAEHSALGENLEGVCKTLANYSFGGFLLFRGLLWGSRFDYLLDFVLRFWFYKLRHRW